MNARSKPLSEAVLRRLTNDALTTFLGAGERYEAAARPGLQLLSTAMVQARNNGARRFFLGATPAGFRLYEGLGFETVCSARVWVSGETHQA
jgi:hypothetical protein